MNTRIVTPLIYIYIYIYTQLTSTSALEHLKSSWEEYLGVEITDEQWKRALNRFMAYHGLIQFKVIHRLHWSKQKLGKIFPEVDPSM